MFLWKNQPAENEKDRADSKVENRKSIHKMKLK